MPSIIDGLISVLGGTYCTLVGFGIVRPSKDPDKAKAFVAKYGTFMKIAGLAVVAFGALSIARGI